MRRENKDLKEFKASLREGLKFARGKKAKVKVETIFIRKFSSGNDRVLEKKVLKKAQ